MRTRARRLSRLALFGLLSGAPIVYAAIGGIDLTGQQRSSPATIGALEIGSTVVSANAPAAPTGLLLTRVTVP